MFPSLGKPASGRRRHLSRDAANEVSSTPTSAHANARANSDSSTFYPALDAGFSAAANAAAGEQIQKALDSQLNQDTMVLDPSSHQPLDASSSAAANAAADEQTQRALDSQLHQNTMMVDPSYHPAPFAGSGSSSAAITPTVEQAPQGPDSWLIREGPMNMAFLENPFVDEVEGQYETVRRQNRRRGRGGRGQSYGRGRSQARGHFQSRGQVQGRGQVQDRGQSQGQVNQGGPTRLVIVGDYKEEDYLKSKAAMTAFIQEKRKRQRPVSDEIPVAMRPSARSTEEGNDMLDFVMLAPLGYHQVARPTGLIRAAIKVGNSEIIGNPFKSIKNYSVKVKLDDDRNGQASISLRFRINKSSRVEKREVSLNDSDT